MATLNSNRIPLHVNHDNAAAANGSNYTTYRTTSTKSSGIDGGGGGEFHSAFDMRNMNDETERIKNRMREFEDRCKKWREDFFARSQTINNNEQRHDHESAKTSSMFDQRVPFQSNESAPSPTFQYSSPLGTVGTPPPSAYTSTMHKSYLEDAKDGSGAKVYKIEFEIGDFNQNELLITTNGRCLCVKGDRELKAGAATETKTFNREITLPDYVNINQMNAYLLDNIVPSASSTTTRYISVIGLYFCLK